MHSRIVNKTRYDDLGRNLSNKQFIKVKRSLRSSTKHLCLNSTLSIDELTIETFYHFKTSEVFII